MTHRLFFRFLPALACMVAIFWLSSIPGETLISSARPFFKQAPTTIPARVGKKPVRIEWLKIGHFIGYAALGAALLHGFAPTTRRPGLWAMAGAALYAASDEIHQAFVPGRHAGWQDLALDIAAAGLAILLLTLLLALARRVKKRTP